MGEQQTTEQAISAACFENVKTKAVQCAYCGKWFIAKRIKRNKRYCSNACKQAAYRDRVNGWQAARPE
ncbi:MAG: hypothetical protein WHX52_18470 [Anaerolineae bacterium]